MSSLDYPNIKRVATLGGMMTRKERAFAIEGASGGIIAILLIFLIPVVVSVRDSMAVVCGGAIVLGYAAWLAYFVYRVNRDL